jgi:hypothetical protein
VTTTRVYRQSGQLFQKFKYGPSGSPSVGPNHTATTRGCTVTHPPQQPNPNEQPPAFPEHPVYEQTPPYGYQPRPRRSTGLILTLAGVGVVGLIITLVLVLTGGSGSSPQAVTDTVMSAIDDKDTPALRATLCNPGKTESDFEFDRIPKDVALKATLIKLSQPDGNENASASLQIAPVRAGKPYGDYLNMEIAIQNNNGTWCVTNARTRI